MSFLAHSTASRLFEDVLFDELCDIHRRRSGSMNVNAIQLWRDILMRDMTVQVDATMAAVLVVRDRMRGGGSVTAPDYFEMTRRWAALRRQARASLADVDALLVPTTLIPPLPSAPLSTDLAEYARRNVQYLRNTAIGNILGLCGLSVPCGFTRKGFPIGLMIYGKPFAERTVLRVGHAYEQATSWHLRTPDLSWATGA